MKTLYLDIFSGISGDMFIGALLDLGVDSGELERELGKLGLNHYHLHVARTQKSTIEGVKFDVHVDEDHSHEAEPSNHEHPHVHAPSEEHALGGGPTGGVLIETSFGKAELTVFETGVPPRFRIHFYNSQRRSIARPKANAVQLETVRPDGSRQVFTFKQQRGFLEARDELPEPHEFSAVLQLKKGSRVERHNIPFLETPHSHPHEHASHYHHPEHGPVHGHPHSSDHAHGRDFITIKNLIAQSSVSDWVKEKAIAVFHRIALAEGKIHGLPPEKVHFHEVGAVDSIIDIVGACVCLEKLGKPRVLAGRPVEGTGFIDCAHGRFPIPAPATLSILGTRAIPLSQCDEPHELITPTGAALLAEFAESFGPMQDLVAEKIGFGLGQRDNKTRPNVLRAILGTSSSKSPAHDWETDTIALLEANLDDVSPEILGYVSEQALAAGALDVFFTAIQMKKNRPGTLLSLLCSQADQDRFCEFILRETSTFGVRFSLSERRKLKREIITVKTKYGEVAVKVGKMDGHIVHSSPEFESCRTIAQKRKVALKSVYDAAISALGAQSSSSARTIN